MKKNVGNLDRVIRIAVALFIAFLIFGQLVSGGLIIVLSVIGGLLFLTGVAGDCPLYWLLGINTCHVKNAKGSH
jgi:hypothetical protein